MTLAPALSHRGEAVALAGLTAAVLAAALLRRTVSGDAGAASLPGAVIFAATLAALATASGWRPRRPRALHLLAGCAAGGLLLAGPLLRGHPVQPLHADMWLLGVWMPTVAAVAVAEEVVLRGALFAAVAGLTSVQLAVPFTALMFAVIHVPLYGVGAVPLDLAVGLLLGALRVWSGGVAAPAVSHLVADLATPWL